MDGYCEVYPHEAAGRHALLRTTWRTIDSKRAGELGKYTISSAQRLDLLAAQRGSNYTTDAITAPSASPIDIGFDGSRAACRKDESE